MCYDNKMDSTDINSDKPSFIQWDWTFLQLGGYTTNHLAGIIGKVKVTDLMWWNLDNGKCLLVFFDHSTPNLQQQSANKHKQDKASSSLGSSAQLWHLIYTCGSTYVNDNI